MERLAKPPVKKQQRDVIAVHLPGGYKEKLRQLAFDQDRSLSGLIKRCIDKALNENGK